MIRRATMADQDAVVTLLKNSRAGAGFDSAEALTGFHFDYVPLYAERLFQRHCMLPDHLCLLLDVNDSAQGVLMAIAYEHPFGPVRLARETLWWIEPEYRGLNAVRMLDVFEDWARAQDCAFGGMVGMGSSPQVGALYQRRGYKPAEVHYLKAL